MSITILAIESSCDDTSAAIIKNGKVLNNIVATQSVHEKYGGVVPELASRAHQQNIVPVVHEALESAHVTLDQIDAVAYTRGPGLLGSLLIGASFAKGISLAKGIPLIEVNHMQAHILAHFIDAPQPRFPFICLTVSGGHTQLVKVDDYLDMTVLGETLDDAAGEAFDKTAKLLGLPYPGGPILDSLAQQGDPDKFIFPVTEIHDLNFSFSGIKTAVLYFLQQKIKEDPAFIKDNLTDLCAAIQKTLIEVLMIKLKKASLDTGIKQIAIAGGVSANSGLRMAVQNLAKELDWHIYIPDFQYCTDNAGMIAMTAWYMYKNGILANLTSNPMARLKLT